MLRHILDDIDRRILEALQQDGRLSNLALAERVNLSQSACLRRVRRLEADGFIDGYQAKLNWRKIGLGFTVFLSIDLERHQAKDLAKFRRIVAGIPEVIACHITAGECDFMLQVAVPGLNEYRRFVLEKLLSIPGVKNSRSNIVLDAVKELTPLPLNHIK